MGGGRLPREETLRRRAALALAAGLLFLLPGCFWGGDDSPPDTPTVVALDTPTVPPPTPSPTPDVLATPPTSLINARGWLQLALGPNGFNPPCPERLRKAGVACAEGDVDGDALPELAYLVPVRVPGSPLPFPSAVFVRNGRSQKLDEFSSDLTADSSLIGIAFFGLSDRTGDGKADLTYLENQCGATGCKTVAVVQAWDGTAWRDAGPADTGIINVDSVTWEGAGGTSVLRVHGGKLPASAPPEAGPSRASTTTFRLSAGRYTADTVEYDPPEYLYQAFLDADAIFEKDKAASIAAFEALVDRDDLKDWKSRPDQKDRRSSLEGFALFRIVLAQAVMQADTATVTAAIDRVILLSAQPGFEPLFVNVAMEFRRGYNGDDGLIGGCGAVNLYLSRPAAGSDTRAYVEQLFNYGYANPPGSSWLSRICPF